ncbi:MAG: LLM class flavin-dependent oxidoreductase [Actinomycetes bacterium]
MTTGVRIASGVDPRLRPAEAARRCVELEQLGYDSVHLAETVHDPMATALLAAELTHAITLRTAVVVAFARSPTLLAYQALDAQIASSGRFELGLGTQIRQVIEGRYAMNWSSPVERLRDHVVAIRALLDAFIVGEQTSVATETLAIDRVPAYFNPGPAEGTIAPPILVGAVRPRMLAMAGSIADGVITHPTNSDRVAMATLVTPILTKAATDAGRPAPRVIASPNVVTGPDTASLQPELARQRQLFGFLLTTPAYTAALDRLGVPDLAGRLRQHLRDTGETGLGDILPDDVLDAIVPTATYANLPGLLTERYGAMVDELVVTLPAGINPTMATELIGELRSIPRR